MSIMDRVPRVAWTTSRPGGEKQNPLNPVLFVHYSDSPSRSLDTFAEQRDAIKAIRDFHVNVRGWADIGYSFVLTQPWGTRRGKVRVWTGRGKHRIPASQIGHNYGNVSVCVIGNGHEPVAKRTVAAIAELAKSVNARDIKGHRDVNETDCPGDALYKLIPQMKRQAGL
jgi:hypothetical protein